MRVSILETRFEIVGLVVSIAEGNKDLRYRGDFQDGKDR